MDQCTNCGLIREKQWGKHWMYYYDDKTQINILTEPPKCK